MVWVKHQQTINEIGRYAAVAKITKANNILFAVDNTFATYLQNL
jgi:cystathionine beta-lyase